MSSPTLNLGVIETHSLYSIGILDLSKYPSDFVIQSPSIEITAPGYEPIQVDFTPSNLNVFQSSNVGVVCPECFEVQLPDGIWTFKYSVYPNYKNFVEKTFVRVDRLQAKFDEAFISLDLTECDEKVKKQDRLALSEIEAYLAAAVAAGNKCLNKLFNTYYSKASHLLDKYIKSKTCVTQ